MIIELEFGYQGSDGSVKFEPTEIFVWNITKNVGINGEFHGFDNMKFTVRMKDLCAHAEKIMALEYTHIHKLTLTTDKSVYVFENPSAKSSHTSGAGIYTDIEMYPIK